MATTANFSVQTLKSLEIEGIKINEIQGNKSTFVAKGNLEICYSPEYDRFVLRLNNFKYALTKNIPITALFAPRSFRAYTFPTTNGHYIVKLKTMQYPALLQNFETILSTYAQLSYKSGQETELLNQAKGQGEYPINFVWYYSIKMPSKIKPTKCENSEKNEKVDDVPEEHKVKSLETLKTNGTEVIEFNKSGFEGMIFFSNLIEKELANKDNKAKTSTPTPTPTPTNSQTSNNELVWDEFKKKTAESAKMFWKGMDGAANMLSNVLSKKKSKKGKDLDNKKEEKHEEVTSNNNDNIRNNIDTEVIPNPYENYAKPIEHYKLEQSQQINGGMQSEVISELNISDYQQIPDEVKSQIENIIEYIKVRDMNEEEARLNISEKIIKVYPQLESVFRRDPNLQMYAPNIDQANNFK